MVSEATDLFNTVKLTLADAGIEESDFEARVLLESVFGDDAYIKLITDRLEVDEESYKKLIEMADRRISGEPLQYIIGEWEFYGLSFKVGEGVLIPRQDTETLVETSLRLIKDINCPQILDLCSGTGCIPITICKKRNDARITAIELYDGAYRYLCENTMAHGVNVIPMQADALSAETASRFCELDLITANPPYLTKEDMLSLQKEVEFEPETALFGDDDGLHYYREIARVWRSSLKSGGYIAFEIGITQADDVSEILIINGYKNVRVINDLTNRPRVVIAQKPVDEEPSELQETVERISRMERYLDAVTEAVKNCPHLINEDSSLKAMVNELTRYYESGEWLCDYDRDARGELPPDLKRGVLSQDTIYNLLRELDELDKSP